MRRWLLVGFTHKEVRENDYNVGAQLITLDMGIEVNVRNTDIDFKGNAFDLEVWKNIFMCYGARSFDVIFTDGGLKHVTRNDEIVKIKQKLLKNTGAIINYMSPIGHRIQCPFGRQLNFFYLPKSMYDISKIDKAYDALPDEGLGNMLRKRMKMII